MDVASWQIQLRKGAAELVVLAVLRHVERYGADVLEQVNRAGGIVTDGALYPLLSRLEKEGKLLSRWSLEDGPHPRKYYSLTKEGTALLDAMTETWISFRSAMTSIVEASE